MSSRPKNATTAPSWDELSQESGLGTGTAFTAPSHHGLFLKDGQYNNEFLQTFISKPAGKTVPMKPIRQPTIYSEVPDGYQPRTIIYFKVEGVEADGQMREKYNLLTSPQQHLITLHAKSLKQTLFQETRQLRKAWNTPLPTPNTTPKPPPRISNVERKARKAKSEAELENGGPFIETVTVSDAGFGAGKYGKRLHIQAMRSGKGGPRSAYNPNSYDTPTSPTKSQFGDHDDQDNEDDNDREHYEEHDELDQYRVSPPQPVYENMTSTELRLLTAARNKQFHSSFLQKKVTRLETFVGDLRKSMVGLQSDPLKASALLSQEAIEMGEKNMLGTVGGELAAAIVVLQKTQSSQAELISKLSGDKVCAEKRVKVLEKELVSSYKEKNREAKLMSETPPPPPPLNATKGGKKQMVISSIDKIPSNYTIEYITDIEGNYEYFTNLISKSKVISQTPTGEYTLHPNTILIHGGDAVDKGPGDIRVVKALTELKRKYHDRVFLILGNRDINKLRFTSELASGETGSGRDIYWDKKHVKFEEFCAKSSINQFDSGSTLKWMLACTMGCETTFETRRAELVLLQGDGDGEIDDDKVIASFIDSVTPSSSDPFMLEYIKLGQIMLRIGDTLYVHGGINKDNLGKVSGNHVDANDVIGNVDEWCTALNSWKSKMISDFTSQVQYSDDRKRGGEALIDYGVPNGNNNATVIYATFLQNGNCTPTDVEVEEYMFSNNVKRIFVGHTPCGDRPSVIQRTDLIVFMCDSSYSDVKCEKVRNLADNRGKVHSIVTIAKNYTRVVTYNANIVVAEGEGENEGEKNDSDKYTYKYTLSTDSSRNSYPDSLVGRCMEDDWWVKGVVNGKCVVCKGVGRVLDVRVLNVDVVREGLKALPRSLGYTEIVSKDVKEVKEAKVTPSGLSFLERQSNASQKSASKKQHMKAEQDLAISSQVGTFKAKVLVKGEMALAATKMKEEEVKAREVREKAVRDKVLDAKFLSNAPGGGGK